MARSSFARLPVLLLLVGVAVLTSTRASAQTTLIGGLGGTAGYGTLCLGQNDDGSSNSIDISPYFADGLNFFGTTQRTLFVNTNGNITFAGGLPTFTPDPFPVASRPMIAPFWADVDTRHEESDPFGLGGCSGPGDGEAVMGPACDNPSQDGIWWHFSPGRAVFTWDRVGYYQCHEDRRMTFQLILTQATGCVGPGDFDVEFRYTQCDWETGDASGGSGGFGGTPAQAGFDAGNERDFIMIEGSRVAGIARHLCDSSNVGINGTWRFSVRAGVVLCPDAGMPCTLPGLMGACAEGRTNCVGMGTECVQQVEPVGERCDNIDNDCDGMTDEMDSTPLCVAPDVCVSGTCTPMCFEGGCNEGQTCTPAGCVDDECVGVDCDEGERCVRGTCVGACDGVVCPAGQTCRGGRCFDACAGVTCDECGVCDEGACVAECTAMSCGAGESCAADGRCVETACAGVTCSAGTFCRGGTCVDACDGATCPFGETCRMGMCVPADPPDAAFVGLDASFEGVDGGGLPFPDAASAMDAGTSGGDAGRRRSGSSGCACRAPGGTRVPPMSLAILGLGLALALRRRKGDGPR
jgi:MYXO-CTERM domain-containing protein